MGIDYTVSALQHTNRKASCEHLMSTNLTGFTKSMLACKLGECEAVPGSAMRKSGDMGRDCAIGLKHSFCCLDRMFRQVPSKSGSLWGSVHEVSIQARYNGDSTISRINQRGWWRNQSPMWYYSAWNSLLHIYLPTLDWGSSVFLCVARQSNQIQFALSSFQISLNHLYNRPWYRSTTLR